MTRTGLSLILFACLVAGCGGSPPGTTVADAQEVQAPPGGAESYTAEPTPHPDANPMQGTALALLEREGLTPDGRLARVAEAIVPFAGQEPLPMDAIRFFAAHYGLLGTPHFLIQRGASSTALATELERFTGRRAYTHAGVAVAGDTTVVAFAQRNVRLEPLARRHASGPFTFRGTLGSSYADPVLALTPPNGPIERQPLGAGPDFETSIPASTRGVYQVEILATGPEGVAVLANVPVYVGEAPPTSVRLEPAGAGEAGSAEAVAASLLELLNDTRRARGLSPLQRYEPLDTVSLAHSRDMRDADFVGHRSPTTGDTADRIAAASIQSGLILENIGRGYGAAEIHRSLMESPGHRANLLNELVTHVGLGVVADDESDNAFIATQVLIRVNAAVDPDEAARQVFDAINRARQARGASALEWEPNFASAAKEGAESYFTNPSTDPQAIVDGASRSLRRFAIAYRRVGGLMTIVSDPREAERLEPTFDPTIGYVGVGAAQGDRPDTPPNSIAIVIMLGWSR
ncbi:MAG: CAP domain-containing protein [Myxococcota bacterium]